MRWLLGLFILGISTAYCFKGKELIQVEVKPKFGSSELQLGKNYFLPAINDSVSIETLKFYMSDVALLKDGKTVYKNKNAFYLLDLETKMRFDFSSNTANFDVIRFNIGIDSITNSSGVKGGDLDPTKNMYWAWQSGYINFKLEGKSKVCKTRNNVFQYHIGGYSFPNNSLQTITIPVSKAAPILINFDIEKLLSGIGLQTTNEIMSPNAKAMQVAKLYKTVFEVQ